MRFLPPLLALLAACIVAGVAATGAVPELFQPHLEPLNTDEFAPQLPAYAAANGAVLANFDDTLVDDDSLAARLTAYGLTGFAHLLRESGVLEGVPQLHTFSPLTVFAPSNDALLSLSPAALAGLQSSDNRETLRRILMFHFIPVRLSPFDWNGRETTLLGTPVELHMGSDSFFVANVTVTKANAIKIKSCDVHVISSLLFPPLTVINNRGGNGGSGTEPNENSSAPIRTRHGVRRDSFRDPVLEVDPHEFALGFISQREASMVGGSGGSSDQRKIRSLDPSDDESDIYESRYELPRNSHESRYEVWRNHESAVDVGGGEVADVRRAPEEYAAGVFAGEQGSAGGGRWGEAGGDAARRSALLEQMLSANLRLTAFAQGSDAAPEPPPVQPSVSPPSDYQPSHSPPPAAPNTSSPPSTPSSSPTLSPGAIIGIAAGGIALLCATVGAILVIFLCALKKQRKAKDAPPSITPNNPYYDPEVAAAAAAAGAMGAAGAGAAAGTGSGAGSAAGSGNDIRPIIVGGSSGTPLVCHQYPFDLIRQITEDFSETRRIGSGGYSDVYRAVDPMDPTVLWAVKRAKVITNDFKREINEMASKHHPNLVRLLGFCLDMDVVNERTEQILIYEYMLNGDLETWVGPDAPRFLTLSQRFAILIGAAHGLEYLHSFGIVHRDIKLANILLDRHMHAKVADFGLVRMGEGTSVGTTRILGTPGYVDPAYSRTRRATTATDVYSYGIVILEVMTGQRAMMGAGERQINIKDW
ncbi:unnamed protein product, partial [Closterium sp. NIES-54]